MTLRASPCVVIDVHLTRQNSAVTLRPNIEVFSRYLQNMHFSVGHRWYPTVLNR